MLTARYDLTAAKPGFTRSGLAADRNFSMWRYAEVLPQVSPVSLGEGITPLVTSITSANIHIKDEGRNPTGSLDARAFSVAVSMAKSLNVTKLAIASNGSNAVTLSAYAARGGMESFVFMPTDAPQSIAIECKGYGAQVTLINGVIEDCAQAVAKRKRQEGWMDVSELHAQFGIEGVKTLGYELAEQLGWKLPGAIIYPGDGLGLMAIWKAFSEIEEIGWIGRERPRMFYVTQAGASGRPHPLVEAILTDSGGAAEGVNREKATEAAGVWARTEGILAAREGAASLSAYQKLRANGVLAEDETVVLINTACGLRDLNAVAPNRKRFTTSDRIGGIIGPY
ncbi:MAG: pyridoxal-phosphate dependent enzyme [Acidobacteriales bacterium]|nr:pyridoxal-phosphate dependent enzyme [Terriglobales bacterium]